MLELSEEFLLHAHIVVGDGQNGDSVGARRLFVAGAHDSVVRPEELLLKQNQRGLGVLQGALMSPDLRQDSASVEVRVCRIFNS